MAIQSDQEFAPSQIARATFPTAFRGYDQDAVRRFLSRLAAELEQQQEYADLGNLETRTPAHNRVEELEAEIDNLNDEIRDLEVELVQKSLSPDDENGVKGDRSDGDISFGDGRSESSKSKSDVLDESRAIEFLGQETARVLESARSAASDILKRAEGQAKAMERQASEHLAEARARAEAMVADKKAKIEALVSKLETEAEAAASKMKSEAEQHHAMVLKESAKIMLEAETSGADERERSQERAREIVADAETLRQQVVAELIVERREARVELENMGAARDRVAMSLSVARADLEAIAEDLERSSLPVFKPGTVSLADLSNAASAVPNADEGGPETSAASTPDSDATGETDLAIETPLDSLAQAVEQEENKDDPDQVTTDQVTTDQVTTDEDITTLFESKSVDSASLDLRDDDITGELDMADLSDDPDDDQGDSKDSDVSGASAVASSGGSGARSARPDADSAKGPQNGSSPAKRSKKQPNNKSRRRAEAANNKRQAQTKAASSGALATVKTDTEKSSAEDLDPIQANASESNGLSTAFDTGRDQFDEILDDLGIEPSTSPSDGQNAASDKLVDADMKDDQAVTVSDEQPRVDIATGTKAKTAQAMAMVDGFTTIDVGEEVSDRQKRGDERSAAVLYPAVVSDPESPDAIITTVAARTTTSILPGNRGDIELDEPVVGKAPAVFSARDVALTRSGPDFRRQLRRILNDDQSDVLDRLRGGRRTIETSELPAFGEQIDRYLGPLRWSLGEVALAGAVAGGKSELSPNALDNLVRQLAKFIVDQVRIPTVDAVVSADHEDREKILEPIRAIYRDFRNGTLSDLMDDALYESFAIGLYDSIESTERLTWVLDPRTDPDPVCEINAANAAVNKGLTFPSGHARPLAMPGCRCLVVSASF